MSVEIDTHEVGRLVTNVQELRRDYYRAVKGGLKDAAEAHIVPRIRAQAAPTRYRGAIVARARRLDTVVMTTKGSRKNSRIIGLLNYGGNLPRPIYTRRKKALRTPFGPRSVVRGKARISGKHFFERGTDAGLPAFRADLGNKLADRIDEAFRK